MKILMLGLVMMAQSNPAPQDRLPQVSCEDFSEMRKAMDPALRSISSNLERQTTKSLTSGLQDLDANERALLVFEYDTIKKAIQRVIESTLYKDSNGQVQQILKTGFEFELHYRPFGSETAETRQVHLKLKDLGATYVVDLKMKDNPPQKSFFVNQVAIPLLLENGKPSLSGLLLALDHYSDRTGALPRLNMDELSFALESRSPISVRAAAGLFSDEELQLETSSSQLNYFDTSMASVESAYLSVYPLLLAKIQVQELQNQLIDIQNICASE